MGDIADDIIDMGYECMSWPSRSRHKATRYHTCKHCGKNGLTWVDTDNGWLLGDKDGNIHNCRDNPFKRVQL